jgi:hypothetical protein
MMCLDGKSERSDRDAKIEVEKWAVERMELTTWRMARLNKGVSLTVETPVLGFPIQMANST